jgi:hypothetical protein
MKAALEAITAATARPQAPAQKEEEIDPILDPQRYRQSLKEETKREILGEVERKQSLSQATQSEVMRIQGLYPEFSQDNSEAAQLALRKFSSLPSHLKGTPEGAKMVLLEAAAELGLVQASRRKNDDDEFTVSSGNSQGQNRQPGRKGAKVDQKTLAFAKLIGLDTSKADVQKNLAQFSEQGQWNGYRPVGNRRGGDE